MKRGNCLQIYFHAISFLSPCLLFKKKKKSWPAGVSQWLERRPI